MAFDIAGARREGYSDKEIADFLATQHKFNVDGARSEGYSDTEIADYLGTYRPPQTNTSFKPLDESHPKRQPDMQRNTLTAKEIATAASFGTPQAGAAVKQFSQPSQPAQNFKQVVTNQKAPVGPRAADVIQGLDAPVTPGNAIPQYMRDAAKGPQINADETGTPIFGKDMTPEATKAGLTEARKYVPVTVRPGMEKAWLKQNDPQALDKVYEVEKTAMQREIVRRAMRFREQDAANQAAIDKERANPKLANLKSGLYTASGGLYGALSALASSQSPYGADSPTAQKLLKLSNENKAWGEAIASEASKKNFSDADSKMDWMVDQFLLNAPSTATTLVSIFNPRLAPYALGTMATYSGGGQYTELVNAGADNRTATLAALAHGSIEAAIERAIPVELGQEVLKRFRAMTPLAKAEIGKRIVRGVVAGGATAGAMATTEGGEELVTGILQRTIEQAVKQDAISKGQTDVAAKIGRNGVLDNDAMLNDFMGGVAGGAPVAGAVGGYGGYLAARPAEENVEEGQASQPQQRAEPTIGEQPQVPQLSPAEQSIAKAIEDQHVQEQLAQEEAAVELRARSANQPAQAGKVDQDQLLNEINAVTQPETRVQAIKREIEARKDALRGKLGVANGVPAGVPAAGSEGGGDQLQGSAGTTNVVRPDGMGELPATTGAPETGRAESAPAGNADQINKALDEAAHEAATSPKNDLPEPTDAKKEAGNYRKGHISLHGLDISIENPAGSKRSGTDTDGNPWEVEMRDHYGYIRGTVGNDKDHIDTFIVGQNPERSSTVYVIDQINPKTGKFDEHKVVMGMGLGESDLARARYLNNYAPGWKGFGAITEMPVDQFKDWLKNGDTTKPLQNPSRIQQIKAEVSAKKGLSIGSTPNNAEPITVKNGVVHIGKYPASHFETGEDITVPDGADNATIAQALRDAGAVGRNKIFGVEPAQYGGKPKRTKKSAFATTDSHEYSEASRKMFLGIIRAAGGIKAVEAKDITGEPAHLANRQAPGLFRKDGTNLDLIAGRLHEFGYLSDEDYNDVDGGVQAVRDMVRTALNREFVGTPEQSERLAELEANVALDNEQIQTDAGQEQADALTEEMSGEDIELPDFGAPGNMSEAEAMRALGFTEQEIKEATHGQGNQRTQARTDAQADEAAGSGTQEGAARGDEQAPAQTVQGQDQGFELTGKTDSEITDRERETRQAGEKKAKEETVAEAKAKQTDMLVDTKPEKPIQAAKPEQTTEFIKTPDGSINFGEITADQAKAMKRQAGKIRLERGEHDYRTHEGNGLVHIEAQHGKQIRGAGFDSVEAFVAHVAKDFGQVWQAQGRQILVAYRDGEQHMMYVQLEPAKDADGDYFRVNTAFPVRQTDYPEKHGFKKLWDGSEPASAVTGEQPAYAGQSENPSGQTTPNARGQSNDNIAEQGEKANTADAGEELSYNKRNRLNSGLKWDDIADKNDALRVKEVTKANVYTEQSLRDAMDAAFSKQYMADLFNTGKFEITHGTDDSLAYYDPATGKTYFVASNIGKDQDLRGLMLHEIGVHALHLGRNQQAFKSILKYAELMRKMGNKDMQTAYARAQEAKARPENLAEETLGYYVEANPETSFARRVIAWFKGMLLDMGLPPGWLKLTDKDIAAMAANALRGASAKLSRVQSIGKEVAAVLNSRLPNLLTSAWRLLTGDDTIFQHTMPDSFDMGEAAREIDPKMSAIEYDPDLDEQKRGIEKKWDVTMPDGTHAYVTERKGEVWIDASKLEEGASGGTKLYLLVGSYAEANGKTFIGDPAGLSDVALIRRTENMLSLALRFGRTGFMQPHEYQMNPEAKDNTVLSKVVRPLEWVDGDDANNLKELLRTSYTNTLKLAPEIKDVTYNFGKQRFERRNGTEYTESDFRDLVRRLSGILRQRGFSQIVATRSPGRTGGAAGDFAPIGSATLKRAAVLNTLARAARGGRGGDVLAEISRVVSGGLADNLKGILYSKAPPPNQGNTDQKTPPTGGVFASGLGSAAGSVFSSYATLGAERADAQQALQDAESITGVQSGLRVEPVDLSSRVPMRFNMATRKIEVNQHAIINRAEAAQYMAEEILHSLDSMGLGRTLSAGSTRLDPKTGDIAQEAMRHFNEGGAYSAFLAYPLDPQHGFSVDRVKAELFARLGVLYFGEHDRMRQSLPLAYGAFNEIFQINRNPVTGEIYRTIRSSVSTGRNREILGRHRADGQIVRGDGEGAGNRPGAELGRLRDAVANAFRADRLGKRANLDYLSTDQRPPKGGLSDSAVPEETKARKAQRIAQDQFNRFTVIQDWLRENGVKISGRHDVYRAEERMHGKIAAQIEDFRAKRLQPLIVAIHKDGFNMQQVGEYLVANHAHERNAQIDRINPNAVNERGEPNGSGMTDAEASSVLAKFDVLPNVAEFKRLAEEFRSITEDTKQILLDAGIIGKDMADAWDAAYKSYVPLRGGPDEPGMGDATGKGVSVNARSERSRALGHKARDEWVVENIIHAHERAIYLAEKNRVGQHLAALVASVPDSRLWNLDKPVKRQVLRPGKPVFVVEHKGIVAGSFDTRKEADLFITAMVTSGNKTPSDFTVTRSAGDPQVAYMASGSLANNEVQIYVKGNTVRIQLNDPLLARAYKKMGQTNLVGILELGRQINTFLSKVYTGLNPEFIVSNMQRDLISGSINITGEEGIGMAGKVFKNWLPSLRDMLRYSMGGEPSQWVQMYREDGGNTGAAYLGDLERIAKDVNTAYDEAVGMRQLFAENKTGRATKVALKKSVHLVTAWIEHMNAAAENGMRIALYRSMIEAGKTRAEAAAAAKNSTVNFNRKGEIGAQLGALYLFANPSIQGAASMGHALIKGKHKGQAWALMGALAGLAYLAALGFGDDDDWDEVQQYEKDRNLLIRVGDKVVKVAVPYGHGVAFAMGNAIYDLQRGKDVTELSYHMASSVFQNLAPVNPLGDKPDLQYAVTELMPFEPARIFARIANNVSGFQRQIRPESKFDESQPDFLKAYRNTHGSVYDQLTRGMSKATGGTATQAGAIDVSPETIKFLFESATGGTGRFFMDSVGVARLAAEGALPEIQETPMLRKFVRDANRVSDARGRFWDTVGKAETVLDNYRRAKTSMDIDAAERFQGMNLSGLSSVIERYKDVSGQARDAVAAIKAMDNKTEKEKRLMIFEVERVERDLYRRMVNDIDARLNPGEQ